MINISLVIIFLLAENAHLQSINIFMKQNLGKGWMEGCPLTCLSFTEFCPQDRKNLKFM